MVVLHTVRSFNQLNQAVLAPIFILFYKESKEQSNLVAVTHLKSGGVLHAARRAAFACGSRSRLPGIRVHSAAYDRENATQ